MAQRGGAQMKVPFQEPRTEFKLKQLLRNDMQEVPGWKLTGELKELFVGLLQQHETAKDRERCR